MKLDELDAKLQPYEKAADFVILPEIHIVARLDGRSFTQLTKERHDFERPYDERFRDYMLSTTEHLMSCGFKIIYGYTQSDEISLLFHRDDTTYGRLTRKINSVLAGEASAKFTHELGDLAVFDCRVVQLPTHESIVDYFRWRHEDAARNAMNAHCYWLLRKLGRSASDANNETLRMTSPDKNELLFSNGVNFNEVPSWQKRGVGLTWIRVPKEGIDPRTGETKISQRTKLAQNFVLPLRDEYDKFIRDILEREYGAKR